MSGGKRVLKDKKEAFYPLADSTIFSTWEYLIDILMRPFDLQTHLNLRGRAGWELVRYDPRLRNAELVFKRKASNGL